MNRFIRTAGLMASAAFVLTSAGSAFAADPPAKEVKVERKVIIERAGPGGRGGMRWEGRDPERRAQHLRDVLQLRPDQEPALQAFLEAGKPARDGHGGPHRMEMKKGEEGKAPQPRKMLTTPERLDMQAKMMAHRQEMFQKRAAAIKAFYAALSPSQQKAFDALHMGGGGRGGKGGRHVRVMRMHGGDGGPMAMEGPGGPGGMAMFDGDEGEDVMLWVSADGEMGPGDDD